MGLFLVISGASGYLSAIVCGTYFQVLNSSSPQGIVAWVVKFIGLLWFPIVLLVLSVMFLVLALLIISSYLYGSFVTAVLSVVFLLSLVVLMVTVSFLGSTDLGDRS